MLSHISGFPELLPEQQCIFDNMIDKIKRQFELYGFQSMSTSAVERLETLLSKGDDSEIYGIHRVADEGNKDKSLALRFDLTVPLARYIAQNHGRLHFPFKRYQIAPVWRGERAQAGRYRQFHQCDVDIISTGSSPSYFYDIELLNLIEEVFEALSFDNIAISINHRAILCDFISSIGIAGEQVNSVMRIIDKVKKIGPEEVLEIISSDYSLSNGSKALLKAFLFEERDHKTWIEFMKYVYSNGPGGTERGLAALDVIEKTIAAASSDKVKFDPLLARGLSYYTGTVYEVSLVGHEDLGSVCGGGAYSDLTEKFCNKPFSGIGISFGVTRLMSLMIDREFDTNSVLLVNENGNQGDLMQLASILRQGGIKSSVYYEEASLKKQFKYADNMRFKAVIMCERGGVCRIRDMKSGEQMDMNINDVVPYMLKKIVKKV